MAIHETIRPLAEVPVELEAELERRIMSIREILSLEVGSVIKMSRSAGENIDIRIGGALVGYGEIVVLEESVGVRITDFREKR